MDGMKMEGEEGGKPIGVMSVQSIRKTSVYTQTNLLKILTEEA